MTTPPDPLTVACPSCTSTAGEPCCSFHPSLGWQLFDGKRFHPARIRAAKKQPAHGGPRASGV